MLFLGGAGGMGKAGRGGALLLLLLLALCVFGFSLLNFFLCTFILSVCFGEGFYT